MGSENNHQSAVHVLCEQSKWDELLFTLNSILDADNNKEAVISDDDDDDVMTTMPPRRKNQIQLLN